ncbi:methyltransferase type 11 [Brucella anthropi]|uniref:methyltransferase type 11 n=1 Tax=Brucella anthropi TaxID=529 RepID=UPI00125DE836|nr:methyltransferase type 11 [Brucella anthropi]QFP62252.1 methyltransferase type 11 [Brucella anthropi]
MARLADYFRQFSNALRYLVRGDVAGLISRLKWYRGERSFARLQRGVTNGDGAAWCILCTPHTFFIAQAISARLATHGIQNEILTGAPKNFDHDFYIILCPQMFKRLPPANKRALFQLEQSVSSRWFTNEYISILQESFAVIDYSLTNIKFLAEKGINYPKVHYIPIGAVHRNPDTAKAKKYDFVFYGDCRSSDRRKELLSQLQKKYNVKICNNVFGDDMYSIIREAKAVINIHYYEGALLEMPRISECVSLGVPVLSEGTNDQGEYPELEGGVRFFKENSAESMMSVAAEMLDDIETMNETVRQAVSSSAARFNFMTDRFLVAIGAIPATSILETPIYIPGKSCLFALSLPETIERRKVIAANLPNGFELFDGVRHSIGWIGCGASFNAMARYTLKNKLERLVIIEDDVRLPNDFGSVLKEISRYLDARTEDWDIFSGLMADFDPSSKVISVEVVNNYTYVTIDRMASTVFNIYNSSALQMLSRWNPLNTDAASNTIDRYLSSHEGLRVVVALPFIVGHAEEAVSTLWGFNNSRYTPMIDKTESKIQAAVTRWSRKRH